MHSYGTSRMNATFIQNLIRIVSVKHLTSFIVLRHICTVCFISRLIATVTFHNRIVCERTSIAPNKKQFYFTNNQNKIPIGIAVFGQRKLYSVYVSIYYHNRRWTILISWQEREKNKISSQPPTCAYRLIGTYVYGWHDS